ncbi:MAG: type I DNA topoisomerase [Ginsengibacter sp.]
MAKNLLIVESPAKAKTIEKILGEDFEVRSCYGHIRDLEKDDMGIDIKNNFLPRYKVPEEKEKVVKELKQMAKKADEVWLASDEDREGESISWHLAEVLGLDTKTTKRIVFHEITKNAIQNAVQNPRTINMDLVNAQQARRVLDRIVGFELSPVLWRKIGMQRSLSAGRVQSVAVRLIVEKEREINQFSSTSSFKVEALLSATDENNRSISFKAEDGRKHEIETAENFLKSCIGADYTVTDIQVKPGKKTPAAPFTTSTLQQEASRKLGYGVSKTMLLAQRLYESGKISYMRTDSVNLSDTALNDIKDQITKNYGDKYLQVRTYKNKNQSAQEAHEAIRPTFMQNNTDDDADTKRLYELIWKRTIASQMSDAVLEKTIAKINISTNNEELTASGEVLKFDGFLKVYMESDDEDEENPITINDEKTSAIAESRLPALTIGQKLNFEEMTASERFTRPPARYTEASLVKKLEELGIGRPSTYAPTISTIVKRNYVEKRDKEGVKRDIRIVKLTNDKIEKITIQETTGAERTKLFPTDLGLVVTDFLKQHFDEVMDYSFTANIEEEFDKIAEGKQQWSKMVGDFYEPFHKDVEHTLENADRAKGERELGIDPKSGKPIIARMGRYGPMVQVGVQEDEEKPKFAKLKPTQSIETITLEQALELFKLPRNLGQFESEEVQVSIGKFGPYASHNKKFYSLNKEMDPYTVELAEISPMISEKRKAKDERTVKTFEKEKIQILRGPYGLYIKQGLRNYKLNKEQQEKAADLTIEEVTQIIEHLKANPPKKIKGRKKK